MGNGRIPTSYVMELITIHIWEQNSGWFSSFDTLKGFHGVMEALKNYESLNIIWEKNYYAENIPKSTRRYRYL